MSFGSAYPPPPRGGAGPSAASNYNYAGDSSNYNYSGGTDPSNYYTGANNPGKKAKLTGSTVPSYAASYDNNSSGYDTYGYTGHDLTDYTGGLGYYTSPPAPPPSGAGTQGFGRGGESGRGRGGDSGRGGGWGGGTDSGRGFGGDGANGYRGRGGNSVDRDRGSNSMDRGRGGNSMDRGRGGNLMDRGRGGNSMDRGRGVRGRGRGGGSYQPKPQIIKPKPPPPLSADQKQKIENNNLKQLVAPKPPHRILNEMMGGGVRFEYTENPPLPPGVEDTLEMHTLITTIDEDRSSGTGPSHEIAKNICSEHAIMGVVARRYEAINDMAKKKLKTKEELLLEDETPFELASIAIFKMLNEWEAKGFQLPQDLEDVLYTSHLYIPVKERLGWIRGSNLGFSTPLQTSTVVNRKRPMKMPNEDVLGQKNPVAFLNEIRGAVEYIELGTWGTPPNISYTVGANIEGVPYSGTANDKKNAKRNCAIDVLTRLYRISIPKPQVAH